MNENEYYGRVIKRLKNCFKYNDYFIATGNEIVDEGGDSSFPSLTMTTRNLYNATVERGLQVHLPVTGRKSQSVLMPLDFEIYLSANQYQLYSGKEAHRHYFKQTIPMLDYIKKIFMDRGMPFLLDYTTAGAHILFQNPVKQRSSKELAKIGFLGQDLIRICNKKVPGDLRRHNGISTEAASVFSGLTKLACYISLLTMQAFRNNEAEGKLPVTLSDTRDYCINFDNSWCEGSPHMRAIRSPFSLHKKNREIYNQWHQPPLVDVIGGIYNGSSVEGAIGPDEALDCMWDLERAAEQAQLFSGHIPCANDTLIDFIEEYKRSELYAFRAEFESQLDIPHGEAIIFAKQENNISDWTRHILFNPNPLALQPVNMQHLIYDFVLNAGWKPKNVANVLRDLYHDESNNWTQDFYTEYPAEEKSNFWARTFSAIAYWEKGWINV